MSRDGWSIEVREAQGKPPPDWYLDAPTLAPGDLIYITAFWELCSERQFFNQAMGPIPWSKIRDYGLTLGLDRIMLVVFTRMIRELDEAYLRQMKKQYEEAARRNRPKK